MRASNLLLIGLAGWSAPNLAHSRTLEILGSPKADEPVTIRVQHEGCEQLKEVRFEEGIFKIFLGGTLCSIPPAGLFPQDFDLGQLPAGTYRTQLFAYISPRYQPASDQLNFEIGPIGVASEYSDDNRGLYDEGGIWWNGELLPGESFLVEHATASDRLYIVWNTYLASGQRDWRVVLCEPATYGDRDCLIYQAVPTGMTLVGSAQLSSRSFWNYDDRMILRLPLGDAARVIPLYRFNVDK